MGSSAAFMLALVGPVPLVVLSRLLVLVVLLPVVAAIAATWLSRSAAPPRVALAWAASLPAWVALAVSFVSLAELGSLPAAYKQVFGGAASLVRVGTLDIAIGLVLDGLSGPALALSAGLLLAAQTWTLKNAPNPLVVAALNLLGGASFLVLLADGTFALALGAALEAVAILLVVGALDPSRSPWTRLAPALVVSQGLLVLAMALAFWATAGAFTPEGYVPDGRARFVSIDAGKTKVLPKGVRIDDDDDDDGPRKPTPRASQGSLTMLAAPGARVFLDGSATPFATTPFVRKTLTSGGHGAHLVLGDGTDELDLSPFQVFAGGETNLTLIAPTTTFRDVAALVRSRDGEGPLGVGLRLTAPAKTGSAFTWIVALVALSALLRAGVSSVSASTPGVRAALALLPTMSAVYALARLAITLGGSDTVALLGVAGACFALVAGLAAWRAREPASVIALSTAAHAGVAVAVVGAGAATLGILHMVTASAAGALVLWSVQTVEDRASPRGPILARVGAACLGVLPPGVGVAWTALEALRRSGGAASQLLVAVALVGAVVGAAAVWRVANGLVSTVTPQPTPKATPKAKKGAKPLPAPEEAPPRASVSSWAALALAPVALVLGLLSSTVAFDGSVARLARTATPPEASLVEVGAMPFVLALSVILIAAFAWTRAKAPVVEGAGVTSAWPGFSAAFDALVALGRRANALDDAVARAVPAVGAASGDPR